MDCYMLITWLGISSFSLITEVHCEITSATFSVRGTMPNLPNTSGVTVRVSPDRTENLIEMRCTFNEAPTTAKIGSLSFIQGRSPGTDIYQLRIVPKIETIIKDPFKTPQRIQPPAQNFENYYSKITVNILLTDQNDYRCQIIKRDFTSVTSPYLKVNVVSLPGRPTLNTNPGPLIAGAKLTLTCSANVGKPKGQLTWYRQSASGGSQTTVVTKNATAQDITNADGSFTVTEMVIVDTMSYLDNRAKYTCSARNAALMPLEDSLKTVLILDVKYQVRNIKVLNTQQPHYPGHSFTCNADGNPAPTYQWTKVSGTQDLETSGAILKIPEGASAESLRYKCTASNIVGSVSMQMYTVLNVNITAATIASKPPVTSSSGITEGKPSTEGLLGGIIGAVVALLLVVIAAIVLCYMRRGIVRSSKPKNERAGTGPGNQGSRPWSMPQGTANGFSAIGPKYVNDGFEGDVPSAKTPNQNDHTYTYMYVIDDPHQNFGPTGQRVENRVFDASGRVPDSSYALD